MSPTATAIFWPMIAHAVLVFILFALLSLRRSAALKSGRVKAEQYRDNRSEPDECLYVRNNIANQFEIPVLFYAVTIALYVMEADNVAMVVLGWIFVLTRYLHAFVHVTSNNLRYRSPLFALGFVAVVLMWCWLAVWLAFS